MAKKSKKDLVEEAESLGVEVDPDASYSELNALVKGASFSTTEIPLEETEDEDLPWPLENEDAEEPQTVQLDPDPDPEPARHTQPTASGWNTLGSWVGRKVQRRGA